MPFGGNYTIEQLTEIEQNCSGPLPDLVPSYSYFPNLGASIVFDVLFGLTLLGHIFQLARFRRWTSGLLATGALSALLSYFYLHFFLALLFPLTKAEKLVLGPDRLTRLFVFHNSRTHRMERPNLVRKVSV